MYNKIFNPKTGRMVSINSITGKSIINKYLNYLNGGFLNFFEKKKQILKSGLTDTSSDGDVILFDSCNNDLDCKRKRLINSTGGKKTRNRGSDSGCMCD